MAQVGHPGVLAAVYAAVESEIRARTIPAQMLFPGQTVYHSCDAKWLPQPKTGPVPRKDAEKQLQPFDGERLKDDRANRFSGYSYNAHIPSSGGLYCVLQQQALVNEAMYYRLLEMQKGSFNPIAGVDKLIKPGLLRDGKKPGAALDPGYGEKAMADKCVVKIALIADMLVADLSPHNPGFAPFLKRVENARGIAKALEAMDPGKRPTLFEAMVNSSDCSVARGIGLAVANSGYLRGLCVQTVRPSDRSAGETGDNLVFFGPRTKVIPGLKVERAIYFSKTGAQFVPVG